MSKTYDSENVSIHGADVNFCACDAKSPVKMGLKKCYFDLIEAGSKIYEIRLNDEKRKAIEPNDTIIFELEPDRTKSLKNQVESRLEFKNFEETAKKIKYYEAGFNSRAEMIKAYKEIYSEDDTKKYGVVAFKLK